MLHIENYAANDSAHHNTHKKEIWKTLLIILLVLLPEFQMLANLRIRKTSYQYYFHNLTNVSLLV